MSNEGTICHFYYNQYTCDGTTFDWTIIHKGDETHFLTDTLIPLGFAVLLFAVAAVALLCAIGWLAEKIAKPGRR